MALGCEHLIGAGTVLTVPDVDAVAMRGGNLIVSPNCDADVIERTRHHGMVSMPGVFTASEAFTALWHDATALEFFPASVLGAGGIKAILSVLPVRGYV